MRITSSKSANKSTYQEVHDIQPYHKWREYYVAADDKLSPFYGRQYSEFQYSEKIYNYYIHPQWDNFGSQTLYMKILYVDYDTSVACIELIGEWNDLLNNDVMYLKRDIVDPLMRVDITKFIIMCDNVLVYHGEEDDYYEEWYQDVSDEGGWIAFVNVQDQVMADMEQTGLQYYVNIGPELNDLKWRLPSPKTLVTAVQLLMDNTVKQLRY